jgi:hypothetical protein
MGLLLPLAATMASAIATQPSLRFSPPTALPPDKGAFVDSVLGFGGRFRSHALGFGTGFFGTQNSGAAWVVPTLRASGECEWQSNDTTFAVLSEAGASAHNLGPIAFTAGHRANNATEVTSNHSTTFAVDAADGSFTAHTNGSSAVATPIVSFTGIPPPGIKSFRTGGADWLRLPDRTLVASIIVQWSNTSGKRASIVAFRTVDSGQGYRWAYAGSIARADDPRVPSNEGCASPKDNTPSAARAALSALNFADMAAGQMRTRWRC